MGNKNYEEMFGGLKDCDKYFNEKLYKYLNESSYNVFSVIHEKDKDR